MVYKDFSEWFKTNMYQAYRVAQKLKNRDKKGLEAALKWAAFKLEESHKMINWLETAVKEVCSEEEFELIQTLYMTYMHNDFVINSPAGKALYDKGMMDTKGIKLLLMPEDEED